MGNVADKALLLSLAEVGIEKPAIMEQDAVHLMIVENRIILDGKACLQDHILYTGVLQVLHVGQNGSRFRSGLRHENVIPVPDKLQQLFGAFLFALINRLIVHTVTTPSSEISILDNARASAGSTTLDGYKLLLLQYEYLWKM